MFSFTLLSKSLVNPFPSPPPSPSSLDISKKTAEQFSLKYSTLPNPDKVPGTGLAISGQIAEKNPDAPSLLVQAWLKDTQDASLLSVLASSSRLSLDRLFLVPISFCVSPSNLQGLSVPSFLECLRMNKSSGSYLWSVVLDGKSPTDGQRKRTRPSASQGIGG